MLQSTEEVTRDIRCPVCYSICTWATSQKKKKNNPKSIRMDKQQKINIALFADDQAVLAETKDNLQKAIF